MILSPPLYLQLDFALPISLSAFSCIFDSCYVYLFMCLWVAMLGFTDFIVERGVPQLSSGMKLLEPCEEVQVTNPCKEGALADGLRSEVWGVQGTLPITMALKYYHILIMSGSKGPLLSVFGGPRYSQSLRFSETWYSWDVDEMAQPVLLARISKRLRV